MPPKRPMGKPSDGAKVRALALRAAPGLCRELARLVWCAQRRSLLCDPSRKGSAQAGPGGAQSPRDFRSRCIQWEGAARERRAS